MCSGIPADQARVELIKSSSPLPINSSAIALRCRHQKPSKFMYAHSADMVAVALIDSNRRTAERFAPIYALGQRIKRDIPLVLRSNILTANFYGQKIEPSQFVADTISTGVETADPRSNWVSKTDSQVRTPISEFLRIACGEYFLISFSGRMHFAKPFRSRRKLKPPFQASDSAHASPMERESVSSKNNFNLFGTILTRNRIWVKFSVKMWINGCGLFHQWIAFRLEVRLSSGGEALLW